MLRTLFVAASLVALTLTLLPFHLAALALKLRAARWIPVLYHRAICRLVGIRVSVSGEPAPDAKLVVSNHASWLDICIISASAPVAFVAKREVATWPIFGFLAKIQRSVFVDRTRRSKTAETNREIAARLCAGDRIVLFAEGTSSDGNRVLPFRSSLIGAAGDALRHDETRTQLLIQPLSIAYVGYHGVPMERSQRNHAAWYGATDLLPHLSRVLRQGRIDVTLSWGAPLAYVQHSDRKALTRTLESEVRKLTTAALRHRPASHTQAKTARPAINNAAESWSDYGAVLQRS